MHVYEKQISDHIDNERIADQLTPDHIQTDMDTANQSVDGSSRRFHRLSKKLYDRIQSTNGHSGRIAPLFERGIARSSLTSSMSALGLNGGG